MNMNNKLLSLLAVLLVIPFAGLMSGCTNTNVQSAGDNLIMTYVSGICGFTVNVNISVRTTIGPVVIDGSTYSKTYIIETTVNQIGAPMPVAKVTPTATAIQRIQDSYEEHSGLVFEDTYSEAYQMFNNVVAPWEGVYWNRWVNPSSNVPSSELTTIQTGTSESDPVYDDPKPGMYVTAFGYNLDFSEVIVSTSEQVASYLKLKFTDAAGTDMVPVEFKIPVLGTIPAWDTASNYIVNWYEIQVYFPLGGNIFTAIPDQMKITGYETTQTFRASYTQAVTTIEGGDWWTYLSGATLAFYQLSSLFGSQFGTVQYFAFGGAVRPHPLELLQPSPNSAEESYYRFIDVYKY